MLLLLRTFCALWLMSTAFFTTAAEYISRDMLPTELGSLEAQCKAQHFRAMSEYVTLWRHYPQHATSPETYPLEVKRAFMSAIPLHEKLIQIKGSTLLPDEYYRIGELYYNAGRYEEALKYRLRLQYFDFRGSNIGTQRVNEKIAECYFHMSDFASAHHYFFKASNVHPLMLLDQKRFDYCKQKIGDYARSAALTQYVMPVDEGASRTRYIASWLGGDKVRLH